MVDKVHICMMVDVMDTLLIMSPVSLNRIFYILKRIFCIYIPVRLILHKAQYLIDASFKTVENC